MRRWRHSYRPRGFQDDPECPHCGEVFLGAVATEDREFPRDGEEMTVMCQECDREFVLRVSVRCRYEASVPFSGPILEEK